MTQLITMASLRCPMYGKLLGFRQLFLLNLASGYSANIHTFVSINQRSIGVVTFGYLFTDATKFGPNFFGRNIKPTFTTKPRPVFVSQIGQSFLMVELRHFINKRFLLRMRKRSDCLRKFINCLHLHLQVAAEPSSRVSALPRAQINSLSFYPLPGNACIRLIVSSGVFSMAIGCL